MMLDNLMWPVAIALDIPEQTQAAETTTAAVEAAVAAFAAATTITTAASRSAPLPSAFAPRPKLS